MPMDVSIVEKIESDPDRHYLEKARNVCRRRLEMGGGAAVVEWNEILRNREKGVEQNRL